MSKVGDVKRAFGNNFSIFVTNADAKHILNYKQYSSNENLSNAIIIGSPMNNEQDNGLPSIYVTDTNGEVLQLTYPYIFGNGLELNDDRLISMNIDKNTIITDNKKLKVNTANLELAENDKCGIVKVGDTVNRSNNLPQSTFIDITDNGMLYLSSSFFEYLDNYINDKVNEKIAPLISNTMSGFIEYNNGHYYNNDSLSIYSTLDTIGTFIFDYIYKSLDPNPEEVYFESNSSYPVYVKSSNLTGIVTDSTEIGNQTIYTHKVSNITISLFPNLLTSNFESISNENYLFSLKPTSWTDSGSSTLFRIYQNKMNSTPGITLMTQEIKIQTLVENQDQTIQFLINNNLYSGPTTSLYELYNGKMNFNLTLYYGDVNSNIILYNENKNDEIGNKSFTINANITNNWVNLLTPGTKTNNKFDQDPNYGTLYSAKLDVELIGDKTQLFSFISTTNMTYKWTAVENLIYTVDSTIFTYNNISNPQTKSVDGNIVIINEYDIIKNIINASGEIIFIFNYIMNLTENSYAPNSINVTLKKVNFGDNVNNIYFDGQGGINEKEIQLTTTNNQKQYYIEGIKFTTTSDQNNSFSNRALISEFINGESIGIELSEDRFAEPKMIMFRIAIDDMIKNNIEYKQMNDEDEPSLENISTNIINGEKDLYIKYYNDLFTINNVSINQNNITTDLVSELGYIKIDHNSFVTNAQKMTISIRYTFINATYSGLYIDITHEFDLNN